MLKLMGIRHLSWTYQKSYRTVVVTEATNNSKILAFSDIRQAFQNQSFLQCKFFPNVRFFERPSTPILAEKPPLTKCVNASHIALLCLRFLVKCHSNASRTLEAFLQHQEFHGAWRIIPEIFLPY